MSTSTAARRLTLTSGVASALLLATAVGAPPAHARSLTVWIEVDKTNLSAVGHVGDDLFNGSYTAILTAVGPVTCGVTGPHTVIAGTGGDTGNPATPAVAGTCDGPYAGAVTYSLDWVAAPGTSGHFEVVCTVVARSVVCTPEGTTIALPEIGQ